MLSYHADYSENLLRKGYHEAAEQAEEALGPLAGVVGLKAHAHLHDPPAQNDDAQGLDDGEDKFRQIVDDGERIGPGGESRDGQRRAEGQEQNGGEVEAAGPVPLPELLAGEICAGMGAMGNLAVEPADFKLDAADPLPGLLVLLDDREAAHGGILKGEGLGVVGVYLDRLAPGVGVQDIAGQGLQLRDNDGPGDAGNDDLSLGVGGIEAVGGNFAAVQVHVGAVRIGNLEFQKLYQ